jgi:gliding motility-associated-like protein
VLKKLGVYSTVVFFIVQATTAQTAFHNFGNIQIHDEGTMGFHLNLSNDGIFDQNSGLVGFYHHDFLTISGAFKPIFKDLEIVVGNNLFLDVGVGVTNNSNFIIGSVFTPRNLLDINLDYIGNAFYNGETNTTKVDGYVAITNKSNFTFPIGDNDRLRPLRLSSDANNNSAKCAYFYEDPNTPTAFNTSFNTAIRTDILTSVSTYEFWHLDASVPSRASLSWDTKSNIYTFVNKIENIRVVGWNTINGRWEDLGNSTYSGNISSGSITSDTFVPSSYSVITFGESLNNGTTTLENYLLTPNNDGINDFLIIEGIEKSPNNFIQIFNRYGVMVYSKSNYKNEFNGISNRSRVIDKSSGLDSGVYFYIITMHDLKWKHQGYLYLSN